VFIEVNTEIEHHDIAYLQVQKHYEEATGLKADPSCKDITRLCFMSYHPGLFKNIRNEKFKVQLPEIFTQPEAAKSTASNPTSSGRTRRGSEHRFYFQSTNSIHQSKNQYTDGNRNNYIYRLASNCNRAGLSQSDTELLCTQHFDLPEREIKEAVKSVYSTTNRVCKVCKHCKAAKYRTANTTGRLFKSHSNHSRRTVFANA
jgi:hypothetical protein